MLVKAKEPLLFVVNHPGSTPYLYFDKVNNTYQGVIPDILKGLVESGQLQIIYLPNNRMRSEEHIYRGTADLLMLSKSWLKEPEKVIFTIPFHQHRSFLYSAKEFSEGFSLDNAIKGETICTRTSFIYPNLSPYFQSGRLIRTDTSSHLAMLRMLFKQRCDYTVMNEFNALNLINSQFFTSEKLYRYASPVSSVPLNIILRAELTNEKAILDRHIKKLQKNNEIQRFVDRHTINNKNND